MCRHVLYIVACDGVTDIFSPLVECDGVADLVFVVDSSGSIQETRFYMVLEFISNITEHMEVRQGRVRVALVTYSDEATLQFNLNAYENKVTSLI